MSWIADLAGRAEDLLNKIDSEAATVLTQGSERRNSATPKATLVYDTATRTPPPVSRYERSGLHSSISVPSNLSSYGMSTATTRTQNSPKAKKTHTTTTPKKRETGAKDEELMDYLNSPSYQQQEAAATITTSTSDQQPITGSQFADPMVSSTTMTTSTFSSLGHSRHSSISSASSLVALSGRETPGSANNDNESGSCGSTNTDAYITVDPLTDINISAPPSTDGSTSSNNGTTAAAPSGQGDKETTLLRKEVASLNQEMSQVLKRAKESERETQQLRNQVSSMLSHQSTSDRLMNDLQQREMDLQESLRAKDSQLAVLRVRLQEADDKIASKDSALTELQTENKRLVDGVSESSGLHSHALQTLQDRLGETQAALDQERQQHNAAHMELTMRVNHLEEERQSVAVALTDAQRRLEEEKHRTTQLSHQINSVRGELTSSRDELTEYKAKATRILQSKEKLIASLKEERGGPGEAGGEEGSLDADFHLAELQQIRAERDLLREELEIQGVRVQRLTLELSEAEAAAQDQAAAAASNAATLEETITQERTRRTDVEAELRHIQEELRCTHEELTRQKVNFSSRLQERDAEIDRLRKQVAHKQSSSSGVNELEQRVHDLTESLIHKQTNIETLSTEKHSLIIQMERLQQHYDESQKMLNRDPPTLFRQDEVRNRVPSFLVESPFDRGVTRQVKRAYSTLDKFSIRLGVFLRRYPIARVFVIVYMWCLHVWVMVVLLTYTPEIHGPEYHRPAGTMPLEQ